MLDVTDLLKRIDNKTLVVVFPHPDDETMATGGLLIAAKKLGWKTVVICLTRGGAGKIHIHANGYSLKEVREKEFMKATKILGVDEVVLGDFDDGKLKEQSGKMTKWLDAHITRIHPGVVVTYDPSGFYGHPDHIVLSREIHKIYLKISSYPLFSKEGDERGRFKLLFVAVPDEFKRHWPVVGMERVLENMVVPTHRLDLGRNWIRKWQAVKAHKSQKLGKELKIPLWLFMAKYHFEDYHLVNTRSKYKFEFINYKI